MGRREADSRGAMTTSDRSEFGSLQDAALEQSPPRVGSPSAAAAVEVKKHQHKHNLKNRYEVMETLGKGTYGKVKKAVERASLKTVAIKSIRKERITDELDRIHIQREVEITSSLRHTNIIRFYEVFESRDKIVIVMEFASRGELYDHIQERGKLPEAEARSIFRQITSAVHYCHKNGVVHRDLKLENILLDQDLNVKLADFGLSNRFQSGAMLQTYCGSPLYAAPEIVKGLPYQGPEVGDLLTITQPRCFRFTLVDCWALGVLLYALVYSSMPFDGASHAFLTEQISQGRYRRPNPPSDACALIDWLLTVRVEERATVEDVANHWWVNWGYEESVCDCTSFPFQDCPSPLLARYIDWQNQVTAEPALLSNSSCPPPQSCCFISPLKTDHGRLQGGTSSLRKSRKENAIPQTTTGSTVNAAAASCAEASTIERKKPKSILKPQRSFDSVFHNTPREHSNSQPAEIRCTHAVIPPSSTFSQPSSKMPKKGILKNYQGESSCISSSERSSERDTCNARSDKERTCLQAAEDSPSMHMEAVRRRKGILKRNGKFSRSLDLSVDPLPAPVFPDALHQFLQSSGGHHSRPSSAVSEDSLFSSDSFDLLDLSVQTRRRIFSRIQQHSGCSTDDESQTYSTDRVVDGIGLTEIGT